MYNTLPNSHCHVSRQRSVHLPKRDASPTIQLKIEIGNNGPAWRFFGGMADETAGAPLVVFVSEVVRTPLEPRTQAKTTNTHAPTCHVCHSPSLLLSKLSSDTSTVSPMSVAAWCLAVLRLRCLCGCIRLSQRWTRCPSEGRNRRKHHLSPRKGAQTHAAEKRSYVVLSSAPRRSVFSATTSRSVRAVTRTPPSTMRMPIPTETSSWQVTACNEARPWPAPNKHWPITSV